MITIKDIKLLTFGAEYILNPGQPVKVYIGAGFRKINYKVVDEMAWLVIDDTTGDILFLDYDEFDDSVAKTRFVFWGGADWYLDDRFFLSFSIRQFDLGGEKVDLSLT